MVVGPFEAAQKLFIGGRVVPLVVGAFGEVNKDLEKMLRTLASKACSCRRRWYVYISSTKSR